MTTAHGVLLFSRSLLVTGIAVFLAAGAHVTGGDGTPPAPLLAALTALLLPPVLLLSRRQLSLPVLASVLSAGQVLLHGAFSLSPPAAACTPTGPAGHIHHTMAATACAPAPAGGHLAEASGHGWPMTAAHAAAVLLTALLLARGEKALWQLLAWLRPLAQIPAPATLPAPTPRLLSSSHFQAPASSTDACVHRLRGPPIPA